MGRNFSDEVKWRITDLHSMQYAPGEIQSTLAREGYSTSHRGIYNLTKKQDNEKTIARKPITKKEPNGVTNEILDFIDYCLEENDELTANKIRDKIIERFNVTFSTSKIKRIRRGLGWYATGTKFQKLTQRLEFRTKNINKNLDNMLWTDESTHNWTGMENYQGKASGF